MKLLALPAVVASAVAIAGCATILSSGPDDVSFTSDPEEVQVLVNGEEVGTTPVTLKLEATDEYVVTFRKPGCDDQTAQLETHVQAGWVVLDVLAGGIIGIAIDAATGEWKAFNESEQVVTLTCSDLVAADKPGRDD